MPICETCYKPLHRDVIGDYSVAVETIWTCENDDCAGDDEPACECGATKFDLPDGEQIETNENGDILPCSDCRAKEQEISA